MKNCLTIAGSDCSGGAGVQADLKTFSANGTFGMSVITSVVAENTRRVISVMDVAPNIISDQIDAIFEDIEVNGIKIGMLSTDATMKEVARKLTQYKPDNVVCDPVMIAKGGCALMNPDSLNTLKKAIIPLSFLLTPNIPEAEAITGMKLCDKESISECAKSIYNMGAKNVLIKGGHLSDEPNDLLYDGKNFFTFEGKRINSKNTHGTGCTLSSAITANLAKGLTVEDAVAKGKEYVTNAIKYAFNIGKGYGPTNHFYDYYNMKGIN